MTSTSPEFTIERMQVGDIEPAILVLSRSWLDTYVNESLGVTREWIEARNQEASEVGKFLLGKLQPFEPLTV